MYAIVQGGVCIHTHYRQVRFFRLPNALLEEADVHSPNQINRHMGISTYL